MQADPIRSSKIVPWFTISNTKQRYPHEVQQLAPEKRWLEDKPFLSEGSFSGAMLNFRGVDDLMEFVDAARFVPWKSQFLPNKSWLVFWSMHVKLFTSVPMGKALVC